MESPRTTPLGVLAVVVACAAGALPVAAAEIDLRGTWSRTEYQQSTEARRPDPKAPSATPAPLEKRPSPAAVSIAHDGGALTMAFLGEDGKVVWSQRVTTDGAENVVQGKERGLVERSRSRWSDTGLVTKWRLVRRGRAVMTGVDVWSLSGDRRTLIWTSVAEDTKSRTTTRTVFTRG